MGNRTNFRMEDEYITMVRGDTLAFGLELGFRGGSYQDLETAVFAAKGNYTDETAIFSKTIGDGIMKVADGQYSVRVAPEDTAGVDPGRYYYDLEIGLNGDIFTVLKGVLEIQWDVASTTVPVDPDSGEIEGATPITYADIDTIMAN